MPCGRRGFVVKFIEYAGWGQDTEPTADLAAY